MWFCLRIRRAVLGAGWILVVFVAFPALQTQAAEPSKDLNTRGPNGDENANTELIERVRSFLGTASLSASSVASIGILTLGDDRTPFLKDQIRGRPAIHVVLEDVPLPTGGSEGDARANTMLTLDVYLDAETKHCQRSLKTGH